MPTSWELGVERWRRHLAKIGYTAPKLTGGAQAAQASVPAPMAPAQQQTAPQVPEQRYMPGWLRRRYGMDYTQPAQAARPVAPELPPMPPGGLEATLEGRTVPGMGEALAPIYLPQWMREPEKVGLPEWLHDPARFLGYLGEQALGRTVGAFLQPEARRFMPPVQPGGEPVLAPDIEPETYQELWDPVARLQALGRPEEKWWMEALESGPLAGAAVREATASIPAAMKMWETLTQRFRGPRVLEQAASPWWQGIQEYAIAARGVLGATTISAYGPRKNYGLEMEQWLPLTERTYSLAYHQAKSYLRKEQEILEEMGAVGWEPGARIVSGFRAAISKPDEAVIPEALADIAAGRATAQQIATARENLTVELIGLCGADPLNLIDFIDAAGKIARAQHLTRAAARMATHIEDNPKALKALNALGEALARVGADEATMLQLATEARGIKAPAKMWEAVKTVFSYPFELTPEAKSIRDLHEMWIVLSGPLQVPNTGETAVDLLKMWVDSPAELRPFFGDLVDSPAGKKTALILEKIIDDLKTMPSAKAEVFNADLFMGDVDYLAHQVLREAYGYKEPGRIARFFNGYKAFISEFYLTGIYSPGYMFRNFGSDFTGMVLDGLATFEDSGSIEKFFEAVGGFTTRRIETKGAGIREAFTGIPEGKTMLPGLAGEISKKGQEWVQHAEPFGRIPLGEEPRYRRAFYKALKKFFDSNAPKMAPALPPELVNFFGDRSEDLHGAVSRAIGRNAKRRILDEFLDGASKGAMIDPVRYIDPELLDSVSPEMIEQVRDRLRNLTAESTTDDVVGAFDELRDVVDEDEIKRLAEMEIIPELQGSPDVQEAELADELVGKLEDAIADAKDDPRLVEELTEELEEVKRQIPEIEERIDTARREVIDDLIAEPEPEGLEILIAAYRDTADMWDETRATMNRLRRETVAAYQANPKLKAQLWGDYFRNARGEWTHLAERRIARMEEATAQLERLRSGESVQDILGLEKLADQHVDLLRRASEVVGEPDQAWLPGKVLEAEDNDRFERFLEWQRNGFDRARAKAWRAVYGAEPENYGPILDLLDSAERDIERYGKATAGRVSILREKAFADSSAAYAKHADEKMGRWAADAVWEQYYIDRDDAWSKFWKASEQRWKLAERDVLIDNYYKGPRMEPPVPLERTPEEAAEAVQPGDLELVKRAGAKEDKDWTAEEKAAIERWTGAGRGVPEPVQEILPTPPSVPPYSRDRFYRDLLDVYGASEEEAQGVLGLWDAVAERWSNWSGRPPEEFFSEYLAALRRGQAPPRGSLLQRSQFEDTPEFKRWFKQSDVVEATTDRPMMMYHGTSAPGFEVFDPEYVSPGNLYGPGFYFTENPQVAGGWYGEESVFTYHPTREAAEAVPDRYHFVWQEDYGEHAGEWVAATKRPVLERKGYAHKGNLGVIEDEAERQKIAGAVYDSQEFQRAIGPGYLTEYESDYLKQELGRFMMTGNRQALEQIGHQPYNVPVSKILERAGIEGPGGVYPAYLSIQNSFDIDKRVGKKQAREMLEQFLTVDTEGLMVPEARRHLINMVWAEVEKDYEIVGRHPTLGTLYHEMDYAMHHSDDGKIAIRRWIEGMGYDGIKHIGGGITGTDPHQVYIAFYPDQIKSPANVGAFADPRNILYQSAEDWAPRWFYKVEQVITDKMPNRASVDQVRAILKKGGIKKDELEWSNVLDWLDTQEGMVTKDDVLSYLMENRVEVEEVVKGGRAAPQWELYEGYEDLPAGYGDVYLLRRPGGEFGDAMEITRDIDPYTGELRVTQGWTADEIQPGVWEVNSSDLGRFRQRQAGRIVQTERGDYLFRLPGGGYLGDRSFDTWDEALEAAKRAALEADDTWVLRANGMYMDHGSLEAMQERGIEHVTDISGTALAPKYEAYTLPGGEEYRELLLTLPTERRTELPPGYRVARSSEVPRMHRTGEPYVVMGPAIGAGVGEGSFGSGATPQEAIQNALGPGSYLPGGEAAYIGSHWEEPNVLAHVRFNERRGPNGERILFIEEIQSDWHQAGRELRQAEIDRLAKERGIKRDTPEWRALQKEVPPDFGYGLNNRQRIDKIESELQDIRARGDFPDLTQREWDHYNELSRQRLSLENQLAMGKEGAIPPAPFIQSWDELTLKRMYRWAAENDFDGVYWTTGAQQADRYNLAKYVDTVYYDEQSGWFAAIKGDDTLIGETITKDKLADYIGKEKVQALLDSRPEPGRPHIHRLQGEELQVGGQGMVGFYDQILPYSSNKLTKRWGVQVEDVQVGAGHRIAAMKPLEAPGMVGAHGIRITPQMKRDLLTEGLPLFQHRKGAVQFLNDGRAIIHAFEGADFTTVIHETGHILLPLLEQMEPEGMRVFIDWAAKEVDRLNDLAAKGRLPERLRVRLFVDEAGKQVDKINATHATGELTRAGKELWATSFERYVAEGSAPIPQLQSLFERFKDWMLSIYRAITGSEIDVKINDVVRGTMDRLLAEAPPARPGDWRGKELQWIRQEQAAAPYRQALQRVRERHPLSLGDAAQMFGKAPDDPRLMDELADVAQKHELQSTPQHLRAEASRRAHQALEQPKEVEMFGKFRTLRKERILSEEKERRLYWELQGVAAPPKDDRAAIRAAQAEAKAFRQRNKDLSEWYYSLAEEALQRQGGEEVAAAIPPEWIAQDAIEALEEVEKLGGREAVEDVLAQVERGEELPLYQEAEKPVFGETRRAEEPEQLGMFAPSGEQELPLFTGTPVPTPGARFAPPTAGAQQALPGMELEIGEAAKYAARPAGEVPEQLALPGEELRPKKIPKGQQTLWQEVGGELDEWQIEELETAAARVFGTTYDPREAGFVLQDGTLIDFSGKRAGGTPGMRSFDHRDIWQAFEEAEIEPLRGAQATDTLQYFMDQTGAMRISVFDDWFDIDLAEIPSSEQRAFVNRLLRQGYEGGYTVERGKAFLGNGSIANLVDANRLWRELPDMLGDVLYQAAPPGQAASWNIDPGGWQEYRVAMNQANAVNTPLPQDLLQISNRATRKALDQMQAGILDEWDTWQPQLATRDVRRAADDWFNNEVTPRWFETRAVALDYARQQADFSLLDYTKRRNLDLWAGYIFPYHYWFTRAGWNWARRLAARPGLVASYMRTRDAMRQANEQAGRRQRFGDKVKIPFPWLPDWMGGNLYVDPLGLFLPLADMLYSDYSDPDQAPRGLQKIFKEWRRYGLRPYHFWDYLYQSGKLAEAGELLGMGPGEAQEMLGPEVEGDFGTMFPQTRALQSLTAAGRQLAPEALGFIPPGGFNVEAPLRQVLGLTPGEVWDPYRIKRMLGNLAAEDPQNWQLARTSLMAQALIDADEDQTGKVWDPSSPVAQLVAQEYNWTPEDLAQAQQLLSLAMQRAQLERGMGTLGWVAGPSVSVEPRGERAQLEMAEQARQQIWTPERPEGSRAAYQQFKEEYPAMYPRATQYTALPGEELSSTMPAGARANWMMSTQQKAAINAQFDQMIDELIRREPWNTSGRSDLNSKRYKMLDDIDEQYPIPPMAGELPAILYGMNPAEMWDSTVEQEIRKFQQTKPDPDTFKRAGEVDWSAYYDAVDKWKAKLPQRFEVGDVQGGTYAGMDPVTAVEQYDQRYDSPLEAAQKTYQDAIASPAWDLYHQTKDYPGTVGQVGPVAATALIPYILAKYPAKGWAPEQLQQELQGVVFPALAEQQELKKAQAGGTQPGQGYSAYQSGGEWWQRISPERYAELEKKVATEGWRSVYGSPWYEKYRGGGGGGGGGGSSKKRYSIASVKSGSSGGGRWSPYGGRWKPPYHVKGGPFQF